MTGETANPGFTAHPANPAAAGAPVHGERAAWLRLLALADSAALDGAYARLGKDAALPGYRLLRKPETGMAMVRGRVGGTGAQFNVGEVTVSRCAVVLDGTSGGGVGVGADADADGTAGVAYVQGCDCRHVEQAAVLDALLQRPDWHQRVQDIVLAPIARELEQRAAREAATAAQTRVEFFTMARGED